MRDDAETIWRAGVEAVSSERLVSACVRRCGTTLEICGHRLDMQRLGRIAVVGAGKAGAGMAAALEDAFGDDLPAEKLTGWVNVPADCIRPLKRIHLHAARPAGRNEPTAEGVFGAERILEIVSQLGEPDVCIVLLSGGGSALLPAPAEGLSLSDIQAVTRLLMHAGATIDELNCVRKQLSRVQGGRLAAATRAGLVISLIISDVIGDPLDVIASGPTVADSSTPEDALKVLQKYAAELRDVPQGVWEHLRGVAGAPPTARSARVRPKSGDFGYRRVHNHVIGNNQTAVAAAAAKARELGYRVHSLGSENAGEARVVGRELAELLVRVREEGRPIRPPACILSGGEPVVHLAPRPERRPSEAAESVLKDRQTPGAGGATGSSVPDAPIIRDAGPKGGRNQELVLGAVERLWDDGMPRLALLSGGTDGEDGPTDAAGAVADSRLIAAARDRGLVPRDFLAINDSYHFFEAAGGLIKTGPTHTNVMDLRVGLVARGT